MLAGTSRLGAPGPHVTISSFSPHPWEAGSQAPGVGGSEADVLEMVL